MDDLLRKYNKRPIIGDIYNIRNLKNITDNFICEYLKARGFKMNCLYIDIQNVFGLLSVCVAGATAYISTFYEFHTMKWLLKYLVPIYFSLSFASFFVSYKVGKKVIFNKFYLTTRIDSVQTYILLIYFNHRVVPGKYSKSVYELFDENGRFDHELLFKELASLF